MKIDGSLPPIDLSFNSIKDSIEIQAENREIIHAVRAVNASQKVGDGNELVFFLDRHTRRPVIKIVNRNTNEVLRQIPNEGVLRLAEDLKNVR